MKNRMLLALLEEYKKVAFEYQSVLKSISKSDFEQIFDANTKDPDCYSIQTVTFHIIQSGYTYSNYITALNKIEKQEYISNVESKENAISEIDKMLGFAEKAFDLLWDKTDEELEVYSIKTNWGTVYDIEQLMEHAIVHVLRHRRQIENFLAK